MQFIDLNDNSVTTLSQIHRDWANARDEDSENTAPNFLTEIFEILLATVNGRNDLEIIGLTHRETDRLIQRLHAQLLN